MESGMAFDDVGIFVEIETKDSLTFNYTRVDMVIRFTISNE